MKGEALFRLQIHLSKIVWKFFQSFFIFRNFNVIKAVIFAGVHIVNRHESFKYKMSNIELASKLLDYELALNDVKDLFKFVSRSSDPDIRSDYESRLIYMREIERELKSTRNPIVLAYIREMNAFDDWMLNRKPSYWNLASIKEAREIMNAIPIVAIYSLIINKENLNSPIPEASLKEDPYNWLKNKYAGMLQRSPSSIDQSIIFLLWNLCMISQLDDDEMDKCIDSNCYITSFYTVLYQNLALSARNIDLNSLGYGIHKEVHTEIAKLKSEYLENARLLGYDKVYLHKNFFFISFKILKSHLVAISKFPSPFRKWFSRRTKFLREKWIIDRKLDMDEDLNIRPPENS